MMMKAMSSKRLTYGFLERKWNHPLTIESLETMLCYSYEMYELLKGAGIRNERWIPLKDGESLFRGTRGIKPFRQFTKPLLYGVFQLIYHQRMEKPRCY